MQRRIILLIIVLGLATQHILESLAADPTDAPPTTNGARGTSLTTMDEIQAEKLSPLNREIRTLLLKERDDVARLAAGLQSIEDPIAALAVQREISDLKSGTQIAILEVQGRFAREEGRIEQADEIDAAVTRMKDRQAALAANRSRR